MSGDDYEAPPYESEPTLNATQARSSTPVSGTGQPAYAPAGWKSSNRVAGGILEQDLLAARIADDVIAKAQAGGAQPLDLPGNVVDDHVDAVPAAHHIRERGGWLERTVKPKWVV
jgi:hypothetical protein